MEGWTADLLHLRRCWEEGESSELETDFFEWFDLYPTDPESAKKIIATAREFRQYEGVQEFLDIFAYHHDVANLSLFGGEGWGPELGLPEPDLEESMIFDFIMQLSDEYFSGDTIPFFDDAAGNWASAFTQSEYSNLQEISKEQSKQLAIVSDLISRLPLFEKASVDEIFDIRKELERPLVNFRSEIIRVSKDIETAPWNREFPLAVEQLFIEKCEPAILDIEDACKSNKLLLSLITNFSNKPLVIPATSALGLVLSSSTEMPTILAQAISLTAGSAIIATEAVKEWKEKQREIKKNGFYFYYQLGKRFG